MYIVRYAKAAGATMLLFCCAFLPVRAAELNVVWFGWADELVTPLMKGFEAANPDIQLKVERIPFAQLLQTLEVRLSARNNNPDVYMCDGSLTGSYAVRGHAADLTSTIDQSKLTAAAKAQGTYDGKLFSAPYASSTQLFFYNKDLFKAAGIEPPSMDPAKRWTWEKVAEVGRKLRDRQKGVYGLVIEQSDRPYQLMPLAQSKGGVAVSPDGFKTTGYLDSKPFVDAFTFYQKMFNEWDIAPKGQFDIGLSQELFKTGKAAMFLGLTFTMDEMAKYPNVNWGVTYHPYFDGGKAVTPTGSWHLCINPRSRELASARKLVQYFLSEDVQAKWLKLRPYPPVLTSIWEREKAYFNLNEGGWGIARHELANTAVPRPAIVGWREYEAVMQSAIQDINGGADVSKRLSAAAQAIDRELAKYR